MNIVSNVFALLGGLATSAFLLNPTAKAADAVMETPAGYGWYVGAFGGYVWGQGNVEVSDTRFNCDPLFCHNFDDVLKGDVGDGWNAGAVLGAHVMDNLRAEVEVSHSQLKTNSKLDVTVFNGTAFERAESGNDSDHLSSTFILGNLWFDIPFNDRISPYVGGGAGIAHVNGDFGASNNNGTAENFSATISARDWAFAYQLGAGLRFGITDKIMIDAGYRFKGIDSVNLGNPKFCGGAPCGVTVQRSKADGNINIFEHVAQIGVTFDF